VRYAAANAPYPYLSGYRLPATESYPNGFPQREPISTVNWKNWRQWQVNVKYLEELMPNYNFFSNIPQEIRDSLKEDSSSNPFLSNEESIIFPTEDDWDNSLTANLLSEEDQNDFSDSLWHYPRRTSYNLPIGHNSVFQDGSLDSVVHNSSPEISTTKVSIFQDSISKIGFSQVGIEQTRLIQINPSQVGSSELNADQIRLAQIGISQVNLTQVETTQVDPNQVNSYKVSLSSSIPSEQFFNIHNSIPQSINTINNSAQTLGLWHRVYIQRIGESMKCLIYCLQL
jgi:hypothetical protein